ncbi:MAG: hypothetical protein IJW36_01610 [Clostridia bacterium]|nr:hypothetical protein [Clostridia bacterium]
MDISYLTDLFFVNYEHFVTNDKNEALKMCHENEILFASSLSEEYKNLFKDYKNSLIKSLDKVQLENINRAINFGVHIGMLFKILC